MAAGVGGAASSGSGWRVLVQSYAVGRGPEGYRETCCEIEQDGRQVHVIKARKYRDALRQAADYCAARGCTDPQWFGKSFLWRDHAGKVEDVVKLRPMPRPECLAK